MVVVMNDVVNKVVVVSKDCLGGVIVGMNLLLGFKMLF